MASGTQVGWLRLRRPNQAPERTRYPAASEDDLDYAEVNRAARLTPMARTPVQPFGKMQYRWKFRAIALLVVAAPLVSGCTHLKPPTEPEAAEVSERNHELYVEGQEHESAYRVLYWLLQWLSLL